MFDQMRKNTKTILWVTVVAFIGLMFFAWGADFQLGRKKRIDPNEIGSVNGQPIYGRVYDAQVAQARQNYQKQSGHDVDDRTDALIRSQTWDQMVQEMLILQEARKHGITVSDEEVVQAIMTQPPPDVMQSPNFQTNGRFDLAKYQAALRDPNLDTRGLEEQYRENLPLQKMQLMAASAASVTDDELWDDWQAQNAKVKVSYVRVPGTKFTVNEAGISDAELQAYYNAHREKYQIPLQAEIEYVSIPNRYTDQDSVNVVEQARQIASDAKRGEDFAGLVETYSEAPTSMRGGPDGTYLTADRITDPGVRSAAFSLAVGEVSGVIAGPGGFHVIKVEDRKTDPKGDKVKIADILLPLNPSAETLSQIRDQILQFRQEADKRPFDQVAADMKLAVKQTGPFAEGGFIPGIGPSQELTDFAFSQPVGDISIPFERPDGWMVARLKNRQAPHIAEFSEVQERVRSEMADSVRVAQAAQVADRLLGAARAGTPMEKVAANDSRAEYGMTDAFGILGFPQGIGGDPAVIGAIFAGQSTGVMPKVISGAKAAYVIDVLERTPADKTAFESQKNQERASLLQRRQGELVNDWLTNLRKSAKIEDYRFGVFGS